MACPHNQALIDACQNEIDALLQENEDLTRINNSLSEQNTNLGNDLVENKKLSDYANCMSSKFESLSGFAEYYKTSGDVPFGDGYFQSSASTLLDCKDLLDTHAEKISDTIEQNELTIDNNNTTISNNNTRISDLQAKKASLNGDCAACQALKKKIYGY